MKTKINQQNAQINSGLICAFCWFIFVFIIENARSKKQKRAPNIFVNETAPCQAQIYNLQCTFC